MGQFIIRYTTTLQSGKTSRRRTQPMSLEDAMARFQKEYAADKAANPQRGRVTVHELEVTVKLPGEALRCYSIHPFTDWSPLVAEN